MKILLIDWNSIVKSDKLVRFPVNISLERELLDNKLAYEYSGGKKLSWCK